MQKELLREYATRDKKDIIKSFMNILPDPDLILKQQSGKYNEMQILRKLEYDSHLIAVKQQRILQVSAMPWEINHQTPQIPKEIMGTDQQEAWENFNREVINFTAPEGMEDEIRDMLMRINVDEVIEQVLDALFYGYVVFEIMWEIRDGKIMPKALIEKPQEWFVFDTEGILKLKNDKGEPSPLPENKFLLVQHKARYDNPYGLRLLSRCFYPVTLKKDCTVFWAFLTEKYGMPYLIGKVTRNATKEQRENFLNGLIEMRRDAVAVIEDDESIQIMGDTGRNESSELYKEFINFQNNEISKAILTVTLTTELQSTGAYSATQTHKQILDRIALADKKLVERTINRLINTYLFLNKGGRFT
ncbi:MAG: DUF935 family protein [Ignavibacteriaceae bacterium]|nr:DUF935 family protein [Ignavibacteriaceae bacterium]